MNLVLSLPVNTIGELLQTGEEMLSRLPQGGRTPELVFDLEGLGGLLHPLSLLPDRLQDMLLMGEKVQYEMHPNNGMEPAGWRLLVSSKGIAWLEVTVWRGENLETLTHELEEITVDTGLPDPLS